MSTQNDFCGPLIDDKHKTPPDKYWEKCEISSIV